MFSSLSEPPPSTPRALVSEVSVSASVSPPRAHLYNSRDDESELESSVLTPPMIHVAAGTPLGASRIGSRMQSRRGSATLHGGADMSRTVSPYLQEYALSLDIVPPRIQLHDERPNSAVAASRSRRGSVSGGLGLLPWHSADLPQRLETIPASPFVSSDAFVVEAADFSPAVQHSSLPGAASPGAPAVEEGDEEESYATSDRAFQGAGSPDFAAAAAAVAAPVVEASSTQDGFEYGVATASAVATAPLRQDPPLPEQLAAVAGRGSPQLSTRRMPTLGTVSALRRGSWSGSTGLARSSSPPSAQPPILLYSPPSSLAALRRPRRCHLHVLLLLRSRRRVQRLVLPQRR